MSRVPAFRNWVLLLTTCVAELLTGCDRKAPNQEQCLDFAMHVLGINDARLLAVPGVSEKLDDIVVKCLTTPYDKQLLACVKLRSSARSCIFEFEDRERRRNTSQ